MSNKKQACLESCAGGQMKRNDLWIMSWFSLRQTQEACKSAAGSRLGLPAMLFYFTLSHFIAFPCTLEKGFIHSHAHPRLALYPRITLTYYSSCFNTPSAGVVSQWYMVYLSDPYSPLLCNWGCTLTLCLFAVAPPVHDACWGTEDWCLSPAVVASRCRAKSTQVWGNGSVHGDWEGPCGFIQQHSFHKGSLVASQAQSPQSFTKPYAFYW